MGMRNSAEEIESPRRSPTRVEAAKLVCGLCPEDSEQRTIYEGVVELYQQPQGQKLRATASAVLRGLFRWYRTEHRTTDFIARPMVSMHLSGAINRHAQEWHEGMHPALLTEHTAWVVTNTLITERSTRVQEESERHFTPSELLVEPSTTRQPDIIDRIRAVRDAAEFGSHVVSHEPLHRSGYSDTRSTLFDDFAL
jgi:hypothetical protein